MFFFFFFFHLPFNGYVNGSIAEVKKVSSGICIGALSKATNREHDCIEPWELSIVLEDMLKIVKEMD